jgi:hypothetical protein
MSDFSASERCGCGATITVTGPTIGPVREELAVFRKDHRHIVSVFQRSEPATADEPQEITS